MDTDFLKLWVDRLGTTVVGKSMVGMTRRIQDKLIIGSASWAFMGRKEAAFRGGPMPDVGNSPDYPTVCWCSRMADDGTEYYCVYRTDDHGVLLRDRTPTTNYSDIQEVMEDPMQYSLLD